MIFLPKLTTLLTTSWITTYTYFRVSPLLQYYYPLLILHLISQNLIIFTPTTTREAPLYEMIPNKSTVNNNLKSSYNP